MLFEVKFHIQFSYCLVLHKLEATYQQFIFYKKILDLSKFNSKFK